jgi:hypothetical protein
MLRKSNGKVTVLLKMCARLFLIFHRSSGVPQWKYEKYNNEIKKFTKNEIQHRILYEL